MKPKQNHWHVFFSTVSTESCAKEVRELGIAVLFYWPGIVSGYCFVLILNLFWHVEYMAW